MNTRLSQRVYSEAALEFWLQRLGGDWESRFKAEELAQGRRLYRQGAVRQLELGETDAIVHMRLESGEEAYVVLDWQAQELSVRASVDDPGQRKLLAVAGLYEVEELVGDEASALAPELPASPPPAADTSEAETSVADASTTANISDTPNIPNTSNASNVSDISSSTSGILSTAGNTAPSTAISSRSANKDSGSPARPQGAQQTATDLTNDIAVPQQAEHTALSGTGQSHPTGQDDNLTGQESSTAGQDGGTAKHASPAAGQSTGSPKLDADAQNLKQGQSASDVTARDSAARNSSVQGQVAQDAAEQGTTTQAPAEQDAAAPAPKRRLELHFSLPQGGLLFRAGWRQTGRKRLVPAFGQNAPGAESMSTDERETLIRLASLARRSGFSYDKTLGGYRLDTPERMEQFVARELGGWSEFFDVTQETDVALLARGVQEVSLRARIGESTDGNLSLHWMAGFEQDLPGSEHLPAFTAAERRRLLRAGATPLLLPGRGLVRLSEKQARASERLNDAVSLFANGTAPRYLLFSLTGLADLPVEVSASLQRWRQSVLGGNLDSPAQATALPQFLRPYQRLGVGWMRHLFERGCHGLLADEMGLGKTVQVLSLIATGAQTDKPSLVVCPASVVPVWQAQAAQFFPQLQVRVLGAGCTFNTDATEPTDLWLASYTQLRRHKPLLDQVHFSRAILDEAQFIKNPEAKVTQACLAIRAEYRLALTGTPLENRYLDVWTLFRFLMPGLLGTRRRFEEALAADEGRHLSTLRKQLSPFILRRTKNEVASELPEKVELDLYCPLSDMQRTEYRRLLTEGTARYAAQAQQDGDNQHNAAQSQPYPNSAEPAGSGQSADSGQQGLMSVLSLLTRLRQVACDPALLPWMQEAGLHHSGKLNLLRDRLGEVFANGKKAVVFSQFVKFLDRARQAITADYPDIPVYQLIGTTRDRTRPVERFQTQEGAAVMLVSLKAGGTGITLHAADYVFLLDPWWNPAVEAQAIDRVHRIGQVNRVFVYRMVTAETVEARIAALKQTKRERFEQIVSGASGGDDFREAFRSLESLLGLLKDSDLPQPTAPAEIDADADAED